MEKFGKKIRVNVLAHDGFEETELIAPVDLLKRAGAEVVIISMTGRKTLKGAHNIDLGADKLWEDVRVLEYLKKAFAAGKHIAAICAAPTALERAGIIRGRNVTSYPGCLDENSTEYNYKTDPVVTDGKMITGRGAGCAFLFGLTLVRELFGENKALELAEGTIYPHADSRK